MTRVSVVMGTYNDASHLPHSIQSVLDQTESDLEFIIVNDGSTDPKVGSVLGRYAAADPRIRLLDKSNEGLTKALIDGCHLAMGDFIARIDAGDVMLPDRLAAQASVLEVNPDCAFVSCWTEFCGPNWEPMWLAKGSPAGTVPVCVLPEDGDMGLLGDVPHHGAVMFRRSSYDQAGGYRQEFYYGQDWDLWYRLAEIGSYQVVQHALYRARIFPGSISMTRKHFQDEIAKCAKGAFAARRMQQDESVWLQRALVHRPGRLDRVRHEQKASHEPGFYFIGEVLRRRGDPRSRKYLVQAMRHAPVSPRAYVRWLQSWMPVGAGTA